MPTPKSDPIVDGAAAPAPGFFIQAKFALGDVLLFIRQTQPLPQFDHQGINLNKSVVLLEAFRAELLSRLGGDKEKYNFILSIIFNISDKRFINALVRIIENEELHDFIETLSQLAKLSIQHLDAALSRIHFLIHLNLDADALYNRIHDIISSFLSDGDGQALKELEGIMKNISSNGELEILAKIVANDELVQFLERLSQLPADLLNNFLNSINALFDSITDQDDLVFRIHAILENIENDMNHVLVQEKYEYVKDLVKQECITDEKDLALGTFKRLLYVLGVKGEALNVAVELYQNGSFVKLKEFLENFGLDAGTISGLSVVIDENQVEASHDDPYKEVVFEDEGAVGVDALPSGGSDNSDLFGDDYDDEHVIYLAAGNQDGSYSNNLEDQNQQVAGNQDEYFSSNPEYQNQESVGQQPNDVTAHACAALCGCHNSDASAG